jgi:hypothetical protein
MAPPIGSLAVPRASHLRREEAPEERSQLCSTTGLDIEGQIADGGGLAALRDGPTYPPGGPEDAHPEEGKSVRSR